MSIRATPWKAPAACCRIDVVIAETSVAMARGRAAFGVRRLLAAAFLMLPVVAYAQSLTLKPFKDELFGYPGILSSQDGGSYLIVDYNEARDIDRRDQIPERRVKGTYVSTAVRKVQKDLTLKTDAGTIKHFAVGKTEGARIITIYLHGQGGSRKQGVNDHTFGGNFNRIKSLVVAAGGLYLSPDFDSFDEQGATQVAAMLSIYAKASPAAPIFLACGSMGGAICWNLARGPEMAKRLGGLLLLGSMWNENFLTSAAFERRVPLFLGHGSLDTVFPIQHMEEFYRSIRRKAPDYPVRMVRFETGSHGTPIRMTDWRETINWMLSATR